MRENQGEAHHSLVLVVDPDVLRRRQIVALITRSGDRISDSATLRPGVRIVVIALADDVALHAAALNEVQKFHRAGLKVICYARRHLNPHGQGFKRRRA